MKFKKLCYWKSVKHKKFKTESLNQNREVYQVGPPLKYGELSVFFTDNAKTNSLPYRNQLIYLSLSFIRGKSEKGDSPLQRNASLTDEEKSLNFWKWKGELFSLVLKNEFFKWKLLWNRCLLCWEFLNRVNQVEIEEKSVENSN